MKTKEKPKYNTLQNVGWMVNIAWKNGKRTLLFCLLTAALEVLLNLVMLINTMTNITIKNYQCS